MQYVGNMLKDIPETTFADDADDVVVYTAKEEKPFEIRKEGDVYVVEGNWVRKLVNSTNFNNHESLQYFQRAIKRIGIVDALENMGISEGDTVRMYDLEFDYIR